jgi:acyl-CoA reductase-like NAD-dependent aldehyde dehydrogenase
MQDFKMFIDGKLVDAESGRTFDVFNPATGEKIGRAPLGDKADVDKAVAAAKRAFPIWSKKPMMERSRILAGLSDILMGYAEELGKLECLDHGFPLKTAMGFGHMPAFAFRGMGEMDWRNILNSNW